MSEVVVKRPLFIQIVFGLSGGGDVRVALEDSQTRASQVTAVYRFIGDRASVRRRAVDHPRQDCGADLAQPEAAIALPERTGVFGFGHSPKDYGDLCHYARFARMVPNRFGEPKLRVVQRGPARVQNRRLRPRPGAGLAGRCEVPI